MLFSKSKVSIIVLIVLLIMQFTFSVSETQHFSYASETDKNKAITVFTEPSSPAAGKTAIKDTGLGLDTLVSPSTISDYKITWESSDEDIATVDSNGHVHGTLTGRYKDSNKAKCRITAKVQANGMQAEDSVEVTVKRGYDIVSLEVSPAALTLKPGNSYDLSVTYKSRSGVDTRTEFYFFSSDPSVAFVDPDGKVTAKSHGKTTITVYTLNGQYDSCSVTVSGGSVLYSESEEDASEDTSANDLIISYDSSVSNRKIRNTLSSFNAESESIMKTSDDEKAVLATCTESTDIEGLFNKIGNDDKIAYVQPNFTYTLDSDDPYYNDIDTSLPGSYNSKNQYFHFQSRIDKAWELLEKNGISQTTVVGVVDSGIDADHIDLNDNLILESGKYTRFAFGEEIQDDQDISSRGHGTHVAGIIGAVYGNGLGGAGAASGKNNNYAKVLPVGTVTDSKGTLNSYDVIKAINHAARNGARVINLSFGGPYRDRLLGNTIQDHYYNDGIVFVAAAGNETTDYSGKTYDFSYPSDLREVISVCNIDRKGTKHGSTNYGFAKDIAAPGVSVFSTTPGDTMTSMTGTSMSSPVVSGVCALMLDANPDLSPEEIRNILCGTSSSSSGYYQRLELGYGALDAYDAVQAAYDIRSGIKPQDISISIKTPYRDKVPTKDTVTSVKTTIPKTASIKASGKEKCAKVSFVKIPAETKVTDKLVSIDPYTDDQTVISKTVSTKTRYSGVKYKIGIRKKGSSKWKYYRIRAKAKSSAYYKVSVRSSKVTVTLKKLSGGRKYFIKVQPYIETDDGVVRGAWSKTKTVKTKLR